MKDKTMQIDCNYLLYSVTKCQMWESAAVRNGVLTCVCLRWDDAVSNPCLQVCIINTHTAQWTTTLWHWHSSWQFSGTWLVTATDSRQVLAVMDKPVQWHRDEDSGGQFVWWTNQGTRTDCQLSSLTTFQFIMPRTSTHLQQCGQQQMWAEWCRKLNTKLSYFFSEN